MSILQEHFNNLKQQAEAIHNAAQSGDTVLTYLELVEKDGKIEIAEKHTGNVLNFSPELKKIMVQRLKG